MFFLIAFGCFCPPGDAFGHAEAGSNLRIQEVRGHIQNAQGDPIEGVSVKIKGTETGVVSDNAGNYKITVRNNSDVFVFSYVGYMDQEASVSGRSTINITLQEKSRNLDEVVVTALGIKRASRSLGYAVTNLEMDSITQANEPNFINSLSGKVPGMVVTQTAGGPGGSSRVVIRGNTSISGDNQPLYVIDGVPIENTNQGGPGGGKFAMGYDMGDVMSSLNPSDIESISVLKGPSASALYGSMASNGVIMITMKKGARSRVTVEFNSTATLEKQATRFDEIQTIYGQGLNGLLPQDEIESQASIFSNWGPRLDPKKMVIGFDGVERPYTLADQSLDAFLRNGQSYLAVDNGLIQNVNDKVGNYVWDKTFDGPHNSKITWKDLLNQSSDWSGTLFGLHDWADRPPKEGGVDDWKARALNKPGTVFDYNDVRVNLLAYSLLQVWRKPLPMILKDKIMDPIGASSAWRWYGYKNSFVNIDGLMMQSVSGGGHHGGGIFISALDMARLGLLFLRNGKWKEQWKEQQLISKRWIDEARQPSVANREYGYMWWINTNQKWKEASSDLYYAAGFGGNYIVIDRKNDLVIVTRWMDSSKMGALVDLIIKSVKN